MLDMKLIRENPNEVERKLKTKDPEVEISPLIEQEERVRSLTHKVEELKAKRNAASKKIGELKRKGEDVQKIMDEMSSIGSEIASLDQELKKDKEEMQIKLSFLPNLPDPEIKESLDPKENVCIKTFKEKRVFQFRPKNHVELNEKLDLFDFVRGAKMSGTGWPVYKGMGARLEWALIQYMIETHVKNGFTQVMLPHLVRPEMMHGAGQLPKFSSQLFKIQDEDYNLFLIPTSEVAVNSLHFDEILKAEDLPKKYVCYTPCFRREAGAAGSQERGLIRVHQFNKVEMFCFTHPDESDEMFQLMVSSAEQILQGLNLHYRNMLLVTGDMSFGAAKTLDIEVYLPGQERYYEVSSVSNCKDFQARRSKIRFKNEEKKNTFVHTLNGSGLATSRLMVALLENNQNEDGSVVIPEVLQKYLGGIKVLNVEE